MTDGLAMQESLPPNWAGIVLSMTVFGVIFLFIVKQMFIAQELAYKAIRQKWDTMVSKDDPGYNLGLSLVSHYVMRKGAYVKNGGEWKGYITTHAHGLRKALATELRKVAYKVTKGGQKKGIISKEFSGKQFSLDEHASMRLTLNQPHKITIQGKYTIRKGTGSNSVIGSCFDLVEFKNLKFTWHDRGDLHPGVSTELDDSSLVADDEFIDVERQISFLPTVGPFDIRISWKASSEWRIYQEYPLRAFYRSGWPNP